LFHFSFQKGPDPCFTNAQGSEENILGITNESRVIETAMLSEVVKTVLGEFLSFVN